MNLGPIFVQMFTRIGTKLKPIDLEKLKVFAPLTLWTYYENLFIILGFSIGCMVFFTIIIVTKYFLGIEKCPLFDNGVANGTAPG